MVLLVGCMGPNHYLTFQQTTLEPTTEYARQIDFLFALTLVLAVLVFVVVEVILLFTVWRFRARPGQPRPPQIHGNTRLEVFWTIVPAVLLAVVAVPTVQTIFAIGGEAPPGSMKVEVIGHQWWWEYRYPELGITTANELHIPVGRNVSFDLKSADVVHSFWFPRLGGKRDVVPNHTNHMWFMAEQADTYLGQCAEFCGASHANMRLVAVAESAADFDAWVANERKPAAVPVTPEQQKGAELFASRGCAGCHTIGGTAASGTLGPNLTHIGSRKTIASGMLENTPTQMARWLSDPPAIKPGSLMPKLGLSEADVQALVAYLEHLK